MVTPPTSRPLARASEHLASGRVAEAAGAYRAVLQIDATEPQAHAGLGHCAFMRGQYREAYGHFVKAASLWREREEPLAALGCYTHAVASDPSELDVHIEIAELEAELGHADAARMRLEGLAENYLAQGRADDAVAILEFVNSWEDLPAPAPAAEPARAPEPATFAHDTEPHHSFVPQVIQDNEGTMVISTFLLRPDGLPLTGFGAVPTQPDVQAPVEPPSRVATLAAAPEPEADAPGEPSWAPQPTFDDDIDNTATRWTPVRGPHPVVDADAEADAEADAQAEDDSLADGLLDAGELDDLQLPDELMGDPIEDREATTVRPIPMAAMPPRQPAPPSRDAQGRTLAERLRSTRARAAAPTAPHATTSAPRAGAAQAGGATRTTESTARGRPTAVGKPASTASATRPASNTPAPRASAPASASRPTAAASKPSAAAPARATTAAPVRGGAPAARGPSAPVPTARPGSAARSAPTPAANTAPRGSTARAGTPQPAARAPAPAARATPQPAARASTPTRAPTPTKPAATRPTAAPARATAAPARQTAAPARPTAAPARPTAAPTRSTAASARPAGAPTRAAAAPSGTPPRGTVTTARPVAGRPPAKPATPAKPTPQARPGAPARPGTPPKPNVAAKPSPRGEPARGDGKRVMAVRTRSNAAGVPEPAPADRTLPLRIPAPGSDDDDSRTVLYQTEE